MSYVSWHNYGIGFDFSEFDANCDKLGDPITPEDIERLLAYAPKLQHGVHTWIDQLKKLDPAKEPTIDDYREFDQDYGLELSYIFAETVREAESLDHVFAADDYNCNHFVLFGQGYPWNMNEREKNISREEVIGLLQEYLAILKPCTEDTLLVEIDDQAVENGG